MAFKCKSSAHMGRSFMPFGIAACAAALIGATAFADQVDWTAYERSFNISFPGYTGSETLENFPVLIRLSAERNDFQYKKCKVANGGDLRFSDAEGNLLPSEIDTWDESGESLVWVRVPSLTASTMIKAYYGCSSPAAMNPKDVWSNGYVGVWHLNESARPLADSTGHGLNFTKSCNLSGKDDGYFDNRIEFASSGIVGSSVAFDKGTDGDHKGGLFAYDTEQTRMDGFAVATLEFWSFERESIPTNGNPRYLVSKYTGSTTFAYMITEQARDHRYASQLRRVDESNFSVNPNTAGVRKINEWTHSVYVYDSENKHGYAYVNGADRTNGTYAPDKTVRTIDIPLCLGNRDSNSAYAFPGSFDELRLSSVARSAAWVKATYDTVKNESFAYYEMNNDWESYSHKFSISFPGAPAESLTDFPVLIRLSSEITNFDYAHFDKENGGDLRFADENGRMLDHEIDTWDESGESTVWVKVPTLNSSTKITAYYGWSFAPAINSKRVWSNGYVGVWHLGESARPLRNSTETTGVDFTRSNNSSSDPGHYDDCIGFAQSGAAGKSVKFSAYTGEDDAMRVRGGLIAYDKQNKLCGFDAISLEIWAKVDEFDTTGTRFLLARRVTIGSAKLRPYNVTYNKNRKAGAAFGLDNGLDDAKSDASHYSAAMSESLDGSWNYHCFQYDNTMTYHTNYLNGAYSARISNNTRYSILAPPAESFICLGNDNAPSSAYSTNPPQVFNGAVDELRISNVARSKEWVKATYDTIKNNATFTTYGSVRENFKGFILMLK